MYTCSYCGKKFEGKQKVHKYKFCSKTCSNRNTSLGKPCVNKKDRILRCGYWYVYDKNHPMGGKQSYIAEHRIVMEKHIGRYLEKQEVVHHKNHDITDNRIENLELFASHGEHSEKAHKKMCINGKYVKTQKPQNL